MSRCVRSFALILFAASSGCIGSGSQYLTAAGTFATAAQTDATALSAMPSFNDGICNRRAWVSYATKRMSNANTADGLSVSATDPAVYWKDWLTKYTKVTPAGGNWQQFCREIATSDAIAKNGLAAIAGYAGALSAIANGDYSGASITALVTNVGTLVGQLPKAPSQASSTIAALAGPIGKLEGALLQSYAAKKVSDLVGNADPHVQAILAALQAYFNAVATDEDAWENEVGAVVEALDEGKLDKPTELLEVEHTAYAMVRDVKAARAKRAAMAVALQDLVSAEQALASAKGANDAPSLASLLGLASQLLGDAAAVQAAVQEGASQ